MDESKQEGGAIKQYYVLRIDEIKRRMIDFILERDDIAYVQNPIIEADYVSKIGIYEVKLAEVEVKMRRAKRKLAMAKTCVNNEMDVNLDAIDEVLESEYEKWESGDDLSAAPVAAEEKNSSARRQTDILFDPDKFKKMYRALCKVLHPDIAVKKIDNQKQLFEAVSLAYEKNDYVAILAYCYYLDLGLCPDFETLEETELSQALETYKVYEASALEQLRKLKDSFPQNVADKIKNTSWVDKTVANLRQRTDSFNKKTKEYEVKLKFLVENLEQSKCNRDNI